MTVSESKRKAKPIVFAQEISTRKLSKFWDGVDKGKVYASKCSKCGRLSFPPTCDCPLCLQSEIEWVELEGKGVVETFTKIMVRPASFSNCEPYVVVVAIMNEGVKILAWLTGAELSDVKLGAEVRLVTKGSQNDPPYSFILCPSNEEEHHAAS